MKWWIVEDALCDRRGHWFEYIQTIRSGLLELGDICSVFTDRYAESWLVDGLNGEPMLPRSIWRRIGDNAPRWKRLLRVPAHGVLTYWSIARLLKRIEQSEKSDPSDRLQDCASPDMIFVPTVLVHHLVGWWRLIMGPLRRYPIRVLLFFPNTPIHLAEDGSPQVNADPTARLFVWLIRKLSREVGNGRVILAAETESMVAALTNVTGVKFTYLPHPVRLPVGRDDPNLDSIRKVPLLGAYGAARHEKGSDILQTAIRSVLAENSEFGAAFTMQWLDDFEDEGGRWVSKDEYLQRQPKFRFIQEYFKEGGYMEQVSRTSVMMLPYRDNYALRVSRVVIEAMIMGIPVIATEGTTLHQQAQKFGVCVSCRDGCVDSLKNAIEEAVEGLEQLQARAVEKADAARDHFSVKNFRRLLIEAIPDLD